MATSSCGVAYRDQVFAYIEQEDSPRPLTYQLDLMQRTGFVEIECCTRTVVSPRLEAGKPQTLPRTLRSPSESTAPNLILHLILFEKFHAFPCRLMRYLICWMLLRISFLRPFAVSCGYSERRL
jgi:hypothetical protein